MTASRRKTATQKTTVQKVVTPVVEEDITDVLPVEKVRSETVRRNNMIHCTVERFFCDGNTRERFEALGYSVDWPAGQVRDITADLYNACFSSGARISIVPEGE